MERLQRTGRRPIFARVNPYTGAMKQKEKTLTKAEFDLMSILWDINHSACVHDILQRCPEPRPAYTTLATYMKILVEKGFVDYYKVKGQGKTQLYVPLVTRAEYTRRAMNGIKKDLFGNSLKSMFSFFVREENLSPDELPELMATLYSETPAYE